MTGKHTSHLSKKQRFMAGLLLFGVPSWLFGTTGDQALAQIMALRSESRQVQIWLPPSLGGRRVELDKTAWPGLDHDPTATAASLGDVYAVLQIALNHEGSDLDELPDSKQAELAGWVLDNTDVVALGNLLDRHTNDASTVHGDPFLQSLKAQVRQQLEV